MNGDLTLSLLTCSLHLAGKLAELTFDMADGTRFLVHTQIHMVAQGGQSWPGGTPVLNDVGEAHMPSLSFPLPSSPSIPQLHHSHHALG